MKVKILYADIRDNRQTMLAFVVPWRSGMSAKEAVADAFEEHMSAGIVHDLGSNSPEIILAWHDEKIEEHSEVGGLADLDWEIPNRSILIILYENSNTSDQQIDLSSDWITQNSGSE